MINPIEENSLNPLAGSQPHRDALVIQFDAPEDLEAARDEDAES